MEPQGTSITNPNYFANLTAQINGVTDDVNSLEGEACVKLQAIVGEASASINAELASIRSQISALLPLTTLPTNLNGCINWITNFANPMIAAYNNYATQLGQVLTAVGNLETAIASAAGRLPGCAINVPPMT